MPKKKVLVIEDNDVEAELIRDLLIYEGIDADIASTGKEGIEKALLIKPDLITLDLMLPDISGIEVCARLKKEPSLEKTIVAMLSIKHTLEDVKKAFAAGADDYMLKPMVPEFIIKKVKLYLGMR